MRNKIETPRPIAMIRPFDYRRGLRAIYLLLSLTFLVGGVVAFVFDAIGLPTRFSGVAQFRGVHAHVVGVFCFVLAAYWAAKLVFESGGGRQASAIPYIVAMVTSLALLVYKYA